MKFHSEISFVPVYCSLLFKGKSSTLFYFNTTCPVKLRSMGMVWREDISVSIFACKTFVNGICGIKGRFDYVFNYKYMHSI